MNRPSFLACAAPAAASGCGLSFREGLFNACRPALPEALAANPLVRAAWQGVDPAKCWDVHCHLFGNGDSGAGPWINPGLGSLLQPQQFVQRMFWLNAGCVDAAPGRVDAFYAMLTALRLPLISHAGDERAVRGHDESLGNPLRLRRPLDAGVRVIVAHCASLGNGRDLDRGSVGALVPNLQLFARLMDAPAFKGRVYGDISAVTLTNRGDALRTLLERADWHSRLLNGSDYPLPAIPPLISPDLLAGQGLLPPDAVPVLRDIREHNALLFDFVLKRSLAAGSARFPRGVFETQPFFVDPT